MSAISHDLPGPGSTPRPPQRDSSRDAGACPKCHQPLAAGAVSGLCPKCLMELVMTDTVQGLDDLIDASQAASTTGGLPTQFGRYTILSQLGRGAMGVVHLAKDDELDRLVAIKVPLFGHCDEEAVYRRFQREVRAAAGLRHPNICPIYDVGQIDGTVFMSMAYIAGRPLSEFIAADKVFSIRQLTQLVRKLTMALREAHRHGIVHRDLKPANIMVDQRGEPLIMDFGLASRNAEDNPRVTRSGAIIGTPAYMAPEQLAGQTAGPASDIYALGVVFYELLTGRLPFEGDLVELVAQVARDQPRRPSEFRADVPSQLDAICLRALAKDPVERFASMGEFTQALGQFLAESATAESMPPAADDLTVDAPRSAPWWHHAVAGAGGLTLAAMAVIVACVLAGVNGANQPPPAAVPTAQLPTAQLPTAQLPTGFEPTAVPPADQPQTDQPGAADDRPVSAASPSGRGAIAESTDDPATGAEARRVDARDADVAPTRADNGAGISLESPPPALAASQPAAESAGDRNPPALFAAADPPEPATNRADVAAIGAARITPDPPPGVDAKPDPPLSAPAKTSDAASHVYFQRAFDELRGIAFERRKLIDETRRVITRHDVEIPDAFVKERAELAALNRNASELRSEIDLGVLRIRELTVENTRRDVSAINRLAISADIQRLLQLQTVQLNKLKALGVEAAGKERAIANLQKEQLAVKAEVEKLVAEASRLLERAFWAAEPTGSFSEEQHGRISDLIESWLRDGVATVELQAMYAISLANGGKLAAAREFAAKAEASNSQSALAVATLGYVKARSGEVNEGLRDLSRATRLSRRFAAAHLFRGIVNRQLARHDAALQDLQRVTALDPENLAATRLLAIQLAASPLEIQRDPEQAVTLAKTACERTEWSDWQSLDALAAAYASSGDFEKAAQTQRAAIDLAPDRERAGGHARWTLYRDNRAFRLE